ncbi:MAG: helix-turn-helix transcriptional regulator [Burkholderiales bacterium]|nr:helix-turn-helix transcriptional regulator [Burkholderiales bacterium]
MFDLTEFSDAVLDLHELAHSNSLDQYQLAALSRVQSLIGFDKAWWGILQPRGESFLLHSTYRFNLHTGFVPLWEETKGDDILGKAVRDRPKYTVNYDRSHFREAPGLDTLMGEHGVGQAFCTSVYLPSERHFVFLSLYRSEGMRRYTEEERLLAQYLSPHLFAGWSANRTFQLEYLKANVTGNEIAIALVDRQFEVLNAESGFKEALQAEWPDHQGAVLPVPLQAWLRRNENDLKLPRIVVRRYPLGDFLLVAVRTRQRTDVLTAREATIAHEFSGGASYKEIARTFALSPATVRFYLRSVYEKLHVNDKGELASLLRDDNGFVDYDELLRRYRRLEREHFG